MRQLKKEIGSSLAMAPEEVADRKFLEALGRATAAGNALAIDMLDSSGQQVNVADEAGETALHKVVRGAKPSWPGAPERQLELARDLLGRGAAVDHANADGVTPLMLAAGLGDLDMFKLLVAHEASLDARSAAQRTVLHFAINGSKEAMVKHLLDHPQVRARQLEARDAEGRTPLLLAAFRATPALCAILVNAGADVLATDALANSSSKLARKVGKTRAHEYLLSLETTLAVSLAAVRLKSGARQAQGRRATSPTGRRSSRRPSVSVDADASPW